MERLPWGHTHPEDTGLEDPRRQVDEEFVGDIERVTG